MKKQLKLLPLILPLILFLMIPGVSFSRSTTGYIVELIIFEDLRGRYAHSEDWGFNDKLLHSLKPIKSRSRHRDPQYAKLSWSKGRLARKVRRIRNSPDYNVLLNKRWRQTGLARKKAITIPINTRPVNTRPVNTGTVQENSESTATADNSATSNTDSTTAILPVEPLSAESPQNDLSPYISGQVALIMSRYLHFNVDLHYYKAQQTASGEKKYVSYPVFSERRMKSKEVHYMDHPLVGVIVLATPYKIKQRTDDKKTTASTTH
ncbi:hypothetical protein MNBD_GAMMA10-892 [hydrothermal vent metagenome]|uniref:Uncharacterized protein n=1 Tax=hydrothermal vent metagenome TaxID=652676 RepID=A0A3B0YG75_9ZZZZ